MQVTKEPTKQSTYLITIQIEPTDYRPRWEKALRDARKKANWKGFRQGMVPLTHLKKRVGHDLLANTLQTIIDEELKKTLEQIGTYSLGQPVIKERNVDVDINTDKTYSIIFEIATAPEFELPFLAEQKINVFKYKILPSDEVIKERIDYIRQQLGTQVQVKDIEENDNVEVELIELDEATNAPKTDAVTNISLLRVDLFKEGDAKTNFLMLEVGDDMDIDLANDIDNEFEKTAKVLLGLKDAEKIAQLSPKFRLIVRKVLRLQKAEMDEAFFRKALGEQNVYSYTLEGVENAIRDSFEREYVELSTEHLAKSIKKAFIQQINVSLPEKFLLGDVYVQLVNTIGEENATKIKTIQLENIKWNLIKNKVNEQAKVNISKDEIKAVTETKLMNNWKKYFKAPPNISDIQRETTAKLKDKEFINNVVEDLFEVKILEYLFSELNIAEQEISIEDFMKMTEKEAKEAEIRFDNTVDSTSNDNAEQTVEEQTAEVTE